MVYFSDIFNVDESILESYGAMNISLLNDIPLFIDPFLLYASEKPEYRQLHENILDYLSFLRDKASGFISSEKIKRWYTFPEVKQNWLGYSESGNGGLGLGKDFGQSMSKAIQGVFPDLKNEKITETSHLEKLSLFKVGVGRDNISDFTCNLIKKYLLEYTQTFAMQYLSLEQCKNIAVSKVYFDYKYENWMSQKYILPYFNGDYVILTPKDLLTYDESAIGSYDASRARVMYLKDFIENKDGYKLFYHKGKPIKREKDLQLLFKLTWFATIFDVNAEVNNGRGPVDFKISKGDLDKTLVEFKLASNSKLKQNIANQVQVYEAANNTNQSMKVILYFNEIEYKKVLNVLDELGLSSDENIILIDACNNKISASNV